MKIYEAMGGSPTLGFKGVSVIGSPLVDANGTRCYTEEDSLRAGMKVFVEDCPMGPFDFLVEENDPKLHDEMHEKYFKACEKLPFRPFSGRAKTNDGNDLLLTIEYDKERGWVGSGYCYCPYMPCLERTPKVINE